MPSNIDPKTLDRLNDEAVQFIANKLPDLAEAMRKADSDTRHKGKLTLTIDWSFKPETENEPAEETVQTFCKLDLPKEATDPAKVVWENAQMSLL